MLYAIILFLCKISFRSPKIKWYYALIIPQLYENVKFWNRIEKEDNVVTINAYDINYFESKVKDIEKKNKDEKFTCE